MTDDACHTCGECFHNREHVMKLRDDKSVSQLVHARISCIWPMSKRYGKTYRNISAVPYLIAKGVTQWVPER